MSRLIDLTGKQFGYWQVIKRAENNKNGKARWLCKCTACGKIKIVDGGHLRNGSSTNCGCIRTQKMAAATTKNETGKIYGYLKVIRRATEEEKPRHDRTGVYWNCTCLNCGRTNVIIFGDYLRNGDTTSCGCITSKNESKIADILTKNHFQFRQQFTFSDLLSPDTNITRDKLMFDFGVLNNNQLAYLIEYDGIQHFTHANNGWNNLESLKKTHRNDLLKNKYCFDHNIPLIRIPYNKTYTINDLKLEFTNFLLTPANEDLYYANYKE